MFLSSRRVFTGVVLFFSFFILRSQTLYWVGGSGNFNDPAHWSYTSGGVSANLSPVSQSNLIFDDGFDGSSIVVNVSSSYSVSAIHILSRRPITFGGSSFVNIT